MTSSKTSPPGVDAAYEAKSASGRLLLGVLKSWPVADMDAVLAGAANEPSPTVLRRTDGAALFYPGRVNPVYGPPESGKGWLTLLAAKQELETGRPVVIIDLEDTPGSTVDRLRKLGVSDDLIVSHIAHVTLSAKVSEEQWDELGMLCADTPGMLMIVDAQAELGDLYGLDIERNAEMAALYRQVLSRAAGLGATVVPLDHTPGRDEAKMIGAQHKRAAAGGAVTRVAVKDKFARGQAGKVELLIDKDRHGHVRAATRNPKIKQPVWGTLHLESDQSGVITRAEIEPPPGLIGRDAELEADVLEFIGAHPGANQTEIRAAVHGGNDPVIAAIGRLEADGNIVIEKVGRARLHYPADRPTPTPSSDETAP